MSAPATAFSRILSLPGEDLGATASTWPILSEQRLRFRYPLNLNVRFRSLSETPIFSGVGRAVNLSSGGVLVVSQQVVSPHEFRIGARVEMSIEWPSLLDGRIPLQLLAVGRVVRRRVSDFAATFVRHEFRTRISSPPRERSDSDIAKT